MTTSSITRKPVAATEIPLLEFESFLRNRSLDFMEEHMSSRTASLLSPIDYQSVNPGDIEREHMPLNTSHHDSSLGNVSATPKSLNQQEKLSNHVESGRAWKAGSLKLFPWAGLFSLIGALACATAALVVLWASNNKVANWKVEPSVLIAVITPLANILLGIALHQGSKISWWAAAMKGCSVSDLSRKYEFSDGFFNSMFAGQHADWIAVANVMASVAVLDGPLLQRASTIIPRNFTQNITLSTRIATTTESFASAGFLSSSSDAFGDPTLLSPVMVKVMQDYGNRAQITMDISGCITGACFATIDAAGISPACHTVSNSASVLYDNGGGNATTLFQTGFNIMNYQTHTDFNSAQVAGR